MEIIDQIILHLTTRERKEIRKFLAEEKASELCAELFDILCAGKLTEAKDICRKLYKDQDTNKYYRLRGRLEGYLKDYKTMHVQESDTTGQAKLYARYFLAEQYARNKVYAVAADILSELQHEAEESGSYHLLSLIYELRMSHADHLVEDIEDMNRRALDNSWLNDMMFKVTMLFSMVRHGLKSLRATGGAFLSQKLIRDMLKPIPFASKRLRTSAKFMHRLAGSWRSVIVSRKGYHEFKPFLLKAYNSLTHANAFDGHPPHIQLDFVYMIAHVYYRTHDFTKSREWLLRLKDMLSDERMKYHPLQRKYVSLEASVDFYEKKIDAAISTLSDYLDKQPEVDPDTELMNMQLNLAVYLFFKRKYSEANRRLLKLPSYSKKMEVVLGPEWFFKRNLIDVVFQYELGNTEIARQRLTSLKTKYAALLDGELYNRASRFIELVFYFLDHPENVRTPAFLEKVKNSKLKQEGQTEDLQAILFFCWLRSKMTGLDTYEEVFKRLEEEG
jgi:hypothetical protein